MDRGKLEEYLEDYRQGKITRAVAAEQISKLSYEDIGIARVDHARAYRQGFPEVIFGMGTTTDQIVAIFEKLIQHSPNILITKTNEEVYGRIRNVHTDAEWHEAARLIRLYRDRKNLGI